MRDGYKDTPIGMIPNEWELISIGELRDKTDKYSFTGGPFGSNLKAEHYTNEGIRVIQLQNIGEGTFIDKSKIYTSIEKADELFSCNIFPHEIILAKMAPVARCCKIPEENERYIMCSDGIRLSVDLFKYDNEFVFQSLNSEFFLHSAESKSSGTTRARIGLNELRNLPIAVPKNKAEQSKIASILSTVDDKIDTLNHRIAKIQQLKYGLIQRLLTRGIGHTKFKDSPLGKIPEIWEIKSIGSIATVVRGASPRPKGDPRYYGGEIPRLMVEDVTRDGKYVTPKVDFLTVEGASRSRYMKKGTLVMVCSGTVGIPSILNVDACVHDGFLAFPEISASYSKDFMYYIFLSLKEQFNNSATHGGVFTNLTTTIIKEFLIAAPPLKEQTQIATILSCVDEKLSILTEKKVEIEKMKRGLGQKLLTGGMRVKIKEGGQISKSTKKI